MLIRELYLKRLRPLYQSELIKVITGLRRCGKSVLLQQIQAELRHQGVPRSHLLYYNFEDFTHSHYLTNPHQFHTDVKNHFRDDQLYYLFLDEIQQLQDFERVINSLRATCHVSIFITGSNSQLLSGELATLLSGRYLTLQMYPFTFQEFITCRDFSPPDYRSAFEQYLTWGGLPFITYSHHPSEKSSYINDLYHSIILKDVIARSGLKNTLLLDRIIQYLLINLGHEFSARSIARFLKNELSDDTSVDTIINYLTALDYALFTHKISRFDVKGKSVMKTLDKHFLSDLAFMRLSKSRQESYRPGRLENIVCNQLLAQGHQVYTGKTKTGEIDFVAYDQDHQPSYYQVATTLIEPQTEKREFAAFSDINDNYPKIVLSEDTFDYSRQGIQHYNIIDWLLSR